MSWTLNLDHPAYVRISKEIDHGPLGQVLDDAWISQIKRWIRESAEDGTEPQGWEHYSRGYSHEGAFIGPYESGRDEGGLVVAREARQRAFERTCEQIEDGRLSFLHGKWRERVKEWVRYAAMWETEPRDVIDEWHRDREAWLASRCTCSHEAAPNL